MAESKLSNMTYKEYLWQRLNEREKEIARRTKELQTREVALINYENEVDIEKRTANKLLRDAQKKSVQLNDLLRDVVVREALIRKREKHVDLMELVPLTEKAFRLWKNHCYERRTLFYLSQAQWLRKGWCLIVSLHLLFIAFVK